MIPCLNKLKSKKAFTIVELMIVLVVLGVILIVAVEEYLSYLDSTRITKARADIEELVKAIRLYNIKEDKPFAIKTFSPKNLGSFVGNYLEKDAPLDPWGNYYRHSPDMGIVYSCGPDKKPQVDSLGKTSDDIVVHYLPKELFITRAEYIDTNQNKTIDFGDYIELTFSKPAIIDNAIGMDFDTSNPEKALGTVNISQHPDNTMKARITLIPPIASHFIIGETSILPRQYIKSIYDYTPEHRTLQPFDALRITKRRN